MLTYNNAPIVIVVLIAFVLLVLAFFISIKFREIQKEEELFLKQLEAVSGSPIEYAEGIEKEKEKNNIFKIYTTKMVNMTRAADVVRPTRTDREIISPIITVSVISYLLFTIISLNPAIGLIPVLLLHIGYMMYCNRRIRKKEELFESQIPGFLSSLKSNIQANETPERALINAIDNTQRPLYDELVIAKQLIQAGTFTSALGTLRKKTYNPTLKFLCFCIELAAQVGTNLEAQIEIIEVMLENRSALKRKLTAAEADNKPLLFVSASIIPFVFIFTYFMNEQARLFWFVNIWSYLVFFAVCLVYGSAVYFANRLIAKVGNF